MAIIFTRAPPRMPDRSLNHPISRDSTKGVCIFRGDLATMVAVVLAKTTSVLFGGKIERGQLPCNNPGYKAQDRLLNFGR